MPDKKKSGWSEPKLSYAKPKAKKTTKRSIPAPPATWDGKKWVLYTPETQRAGMAATRKKAQAKRPAPMTPAQVQAVKNRDFDAAAKAARKNTRGR